MLTSLALIFIVGLIFSSILKRLRVPGLVGMLLTGILLGPYGLDLLDDSILSISLDLRQMALVIILLRAGLTLDLSDLKKVGRSALLLSFLPASFEILAYTLLGPLLLPISRLDAALMGSVMAAVSPAVVVPQMIRCIEGGYGTNKQIPQLVMAGASIDDVFVIVVFGSLLTMSLGGTVGVKEFTSIPIAIVAGIGFGALVGFALSHLFNKFKSLQVSIRNSHKVIIFLGLSFLLLTLEKAIEGKLAFSGLLAIISMALTYKHFAPQTTSNQLAVKFDKLWVGAELLLFVLVGASTNIAYTLDTGVQALALLFLALVIRCFGTSLCLSGSKLNVRERLFVVVSYLPKATVQAAIGSIPLASGLSSGQTILSVAIIGILITAPLGALLIDFGAEKWLDREDKLT